MQAICNNIRGMVNRITDVCIDELDYTASLMDFGFDSISYIKLVIMIEDAYDIEFDDEELVYSNFTSIAKIAELVDTYLKDN